MEDGEKILLDEVEYAPEVLPSLLKAISENDMIAGFDSITEHDDVIAQLRYSRFRPSITGFENEGASMDMQNDISMPNIPHSHSVSISLPPSPAPKTKRVLFSNADTILGNEVKSQTPPPYERASAQKKPPKFYSQPMPKVSTLVNEPMFSGNSVPLRNPRIEKLRDVRSERLKDIRIDNLRNAKSEKLKAMRIDDVRYDSFKTWSGKLERNISNLRGKTEVRPQGQRCPDVETLPVARYFDALEGPELDKLKASEEILLPEDQQWPFLLRFPVSSFGICLGVSSQAIMWKTLSSSSSTQFLHVTPDINIALWMISVALVISVALIYSLKLIFYFEAVRREYYHPIRVNFFFAPWIALLFLALGVPPSIIKSLHSSLWYVLMTPIFILELKIYGQWMSGGQRRLSKVANPSNHLSVVGNFVGALLGATMGLKEGPIFFFAIGMAHYTVLFVTLYQRLPTNETLPKELHPVFFLFVAAPSVASMAWARIQESFDYGSRIAYFIALFLYFSLAVRLNFFRGFRFSLAWWAYTFPMTGAAIATIRYSNTVTNVFTKILTVVLCSASTLTVSALLVTTIIHAFVLWDLFPNDLAIAISDRRPKSTHRRWFHKRTASSDNNIEKFLKYTDCDGKDIEAVVLSASESTDGHEDHPSHKLPEP